MKRFLAALLAATIVTATTSARIHAEDNSQSGDVECYSVEFIDHDASDGKIIYKLYDNGEIYKITEFIENNYEKVISYIEMEQIDGTYILVTKNVSVLTENGITLNSYSYISGKNSTFHDEFQRSSDTNSNRFEFPKNSILRASTGWVYDGTVYGSNKILKKTLSYVTQIIIGIAAPGGVVVSSITSVTAGMIADYIIEKNIPTVYYSQAYYEKRSLDVPWVCVTGSKWVTWYYADSNRTQYINTTTEIVDNS